MKYICNIAREQQTNNESLNSVCLAAQVGILPTPSQLVCGKKGRDSGREGVAEMSEWPWHVRHLSPAVCDKIHTYFRQLF